MKRIAALCAFVLIASVSAPCLAQDVFVAPQAYVATSGPRDHWFGWQTLIVMGASTPLVAAFGAGLAGLYFGGPIVHWGHGQVGEGFLVLGINTGAALGGGLIGLVAVCGDLECGGDVDLGPVGAIIGAGLGLLVAGTIDVAALSYEPAEAQQLGVVPHLELTSERALLGVAGVF